MDPTIITAAVSSILLIIAKSGQQLARVRDKYKNYQSALNMIQTECTALAAAMDQIQTLFAGGSRWAANLPNALIEAFDLSLKAAATTMAVLQEEIDELLIAAVITQANRIRDKTAYVWKEQLMADLLQQLRGESNALSLLLSAAQWYVNLGVQRIWPC
jgi:hypothetical protein